MSKLRSELIKLAYEKPELREHLLPLVQSSDEGAPTQAEALVDSLYDELGRRKGLLKEILHPSGPREQERSMAKLAKFLKGYPWVLKAYSTSDEETDDWGRPTDILNWLDVEIKDREKRKLSLMTNFRRSPEPGDLSPIQVDLTSNSMGNKEGSVKTVRDLEALLVAFIAGSSGHLPSGVR